MKRKREIQKIGTKHMKEKKLKKIERNGKETCKKKEVREEINKIKNDERTNLCQNRLSS
jgi:hypothetical protein